MLNLSPEYRAVLDHYLDGVAPVQIGRLLNIPRTRVNVIVQQLRTKGAIPKTLRAKVGRPKTRHAALLPIILSLESTIENIHNTKRATRTLRYVIDVLRDMYDPNISHIEEVRQVHDRN